MKLHGAKDRALLATASVIHFGLIEFYLGRRLNLTPDVNHDFEAAIGRYRVMR